MTAPPDGNNKNALKGCGLGCLGLVAAIFVLLYIVPSPPGTRPTPPVKAREDPDVIRAAEAELRRHMIENGSPVSKALDKNASPERYRILSTWEQHGQSWAIIIVPPDSSPSKVIQAARAIHKKYPRMAFYVVNTEQGIGPFDAWAKDEKKPPMEWVMKHYLAIANDFFQLNGGGSRWEIGPAGLFASAFESTPLE